MVLIRLDRQALARHAALEAEGDESADSEHASTASMWKQMGIMLMGLAAMALGGPALVEGALRFADLLGVRQGVVGLTLVSLGTGAEMVALAVIATRKHQADLLVGGILGSFAYNLLVTLGLAAAIHPLPVDHHLIQIALPVMIGVHLVLLALVLAGRIPRLVGGILLLSYVAYLVSIGFSDA